MKSIAVFASGEWTNTENIIKKFSDNASIQVAKVFSNNAKAWVLERAKRLGVPATVFNKEEFYTTDTIIKELKKLEIDLIVLSWFLWLVPKAMIDQFNHKIINVHPSLLPAYGGPGMYWDRVHKAVLSNKEKESGITFHYVNEYFDDWEKIFQTTCSVTQNDTVETLREKIHKLEHHYYPDVIAKVLWDQ